MAFGKLKAAGLPKMSVKLNKMAKANKLSYPSIKQPKVSKDKTSKPFDFSKYTKLAKAPKVPKITLIKKAIKKAKPKGF